MDRINKISGPCSNVLENDEKYPNFEAVQEMIKSISITKHDKHSDHNSQTGSYKGTKRKIEVFEDDDASLLDYESSQQEKINDLQKCITDQMIDFEKINNVENLQIAVKKLQNKLERQKCLRDYNYSDRNIEIQSLNDINKPFENVKDELENILLLKSLSYDNAKELVEFLFHHKIPLKMKLFIILKLEEECVNNKDTIRNAFDKSMIQLLESLLEKYCCTVSVFGRKNVQIEEKVRPPKELCLLKPLTKIFANISYSQSKFLHFHILSLLINAVTFIASNVENIQKKINVICQGKTLTGNIFKLNPQDSSLLLSNIIGLRLDDWISGAYDVILYGDIGKERNKNVNEEIIKIQPIMNCTKSDSIQVDFSEYANGTDKKYVTIIRAKATKYILMYIGKNWESHLINISDDIQRFTKIKADDYFRNGNIVGFHHDDVTFENPLQKYPPFLRGLIVSQQRGNVLIWAMDIGTWVYARREKLVSIMHTELHLLEPLICIGQLKGPVCDIDEEFLMYGLAILRHAVFKNNEIAKKILFPDAGENLLLLAQHHNSGIRNHVFGILLTLTNFKEGCMFLHAKEFDIFLTGKLEFWAHISKLNLKHHHRIKKEIYVMVKILSAILKVNPDRKWCGIMQAQRALKILMVGENQNTDIFEYVLHQLEEIETEDERKHVHTSNMEMARITTKEETQQNMTSLAPQGNVLESTNLNVNHLENEMILRGKQKIKEDSSFVLESVINVKSNSSTHIVEGKDSNDIRPLEMSEVICGLLNNNTEGCVYFGLSNNSVITGITMQDNDIKVLVKDIEIIVKRFVRPSLSDSNYSIQFTPVLENKNSRLQIKAKVYVIQIKLYPHKRVVYSLHNGTKYYTRKGTVTIEHNTEKKKHSKEEEQHNNVQSNTLVSSSNSTPSVSDASNMETTETEISNQLLGQGNNFSSHKNVRFTTDENCGDSSHSSETASGNLISPVFHFIKKLIPNTANE